MPAKPPDSFQAASTGLPPEGVTRMPMSWLYPAVEVHRSLLALSRTSSELPGVMVKARLVSSITCQVEPSLLGSWYCRVLTAVIPPAGATPESGVTELEGTPELFPAPLTEATSKNHGVPLVRPVTGADVAASPETGCALPTWAPRSFHVVTE